MGEIIGAASAKHQAQLECLCEFCGADRIIYEDLGKSERYTLEKNGKMLYLMANGNQYDGGFLSVSSTAKV